MKGLPKLQFISAPFGAGDTQRAVIAQEPTRSNQISISRGIPLAYSVPKSNGGVAFTRHEMNQIGYLATQGTYLNEIGCGYEWNREYADAIGGYPKGAILKLILWSDDSSTRYPLEVLDIISLVDNNLSTPTLAASSTQAESVTLPQAYYGNYNEVNDPYWAVVDKRSHYNFFPDLRTKRQIYTREFTRQEHLTTPVFGADSGTSWFCVEREIERWNNLSDTEKITAPNVNIIPEDYSSYSYRGVIDSIYGFEGALASRFVPNFKFALDVNYGSQHTNIGKLTISVYEFDMITDEQ